jgi:hypothetical protein
MALDACAVVEAMRISLLLAALAAAGCTKSPVAVQAIGAVCMRAKELSGKADTERVLIANALLEGGDRVRLAMRCEATRQLDQAVHDVYVIILDAQLVTTDRWAPMSASIRKLVSPTDACTAIENGAPDAHEKVRGWLEETRARHDDAHQACRALAK